MCEDKSMGHSQIQAVDVSMFQPRLRKKKLYSGHGSFLPRNWYYEATVRLK